MKIKLIIQSFAFSLLLITGLGLNAQDTTRITPVVKLNYLALPGDTVKLTAEIFVRKDNGVFALKNADIEFLTSNGKESKTLGVVKADDAGSVTRAVQIRDLFADKEGKIVYTARFAGKGSYAPGSAEIAYKPAKITLSFTEEDSVKTIHVQGMQIGTDNTEKPLAKEKLTVYVPRMLSNLKIGEIELDDNGTGTMAYPGGIIGDSLGNITIYAMIEENDNFGFVRGEGNVKWGIPKHYLLAERPTRELWTPIAPVWMIVTLIIMLTGVWAHYIFAVIQLIMIKRENKKNKDYI